MHLPLSASPPPLSASFPSATYCTMVTELPRIPDDITAEWLLPKIGLTTASITRTGGYDGTATIVKLSVTPEGEDANVDSQAKLDICVKGGFNPDMLSMFPFVLALYTREVDFYNSIAPTVPNIRLPKNLWARKNAENAVIIMEDVACSSGFVFGDPIDTWSVDRVKLVAEQLAALHAATWGSTAQSMPWLGDHYDQSVFRICDMWDDIMLAGDRPPVPAYMKDRARMTAAIKTRLATRNPRFSAILHGDTHLGNAAWSASVGGPMLVDWQTIHLGSCFSDVAYFVMTALTVEDRRAHEMGILDFYLARLHAFGGPRLSRDDPEVMDEYRKSVLAGYMWVLCPYTMQKKERVWAVVARLVPAMEDHDPVSLLESAALLT